MHNSFDSNLLKIYKNCRPCTKLHLLARFYTCPFFEVETYVPMNGLILDYGCGHGIFSHILSRLSEERRVFGYDISSPKINQAMKSSENNLRPRFIENSFEAESLIKKADCIVFLDVFYCYPTGEREEFLKWLYANIKPGAILIIKDQDRQLSVKFLFLYLQEILAVMVLKITKSKGLFFFSKEYLLDLLKGIGFSVEVQDLSKGYLYPHIAFICRKG